MATDITKLDYADVIREVLEIRDRCDKVLAILIPDGDESPRCPHPPASIENLSTMDDDGERYRCRVCGREQFMPFHTEE